MGFFDEAISNAVGSVNDFIAAPAAAISSGVANAGTVVDKTVNDNVLVKYSPIGLGLNTVQTVTGLTPSTQLAAVGAVVGGIAAGSMLTGTAAAGATQAEMLAAQEAGLGAASVGLGAAGAGVAAAAPAITGIGTAGAIAGAAETVKSIAAALAPAAPVEAANNAVQAAQSAAMPPSTMLLIGGGVLALLTIVMVVKS